MKRSIKGSYMQGWQLIERTAHRFPRAPIVDIVDSALTRTVLRHLTEAKDCLTPRTIFMNAGDQYNVLLELYFDLFPWNLWYRTTSEGYLLFQNKIGFWLNRYFGSYLVFCHSDIIHLEYLEYNFDILG